MSMAVESFDPFDDAAFDRWYDAYYASEVADRECNTAYAREEVRAAFRSDNPGVRRRQLQGREGDVIVGTAGLGLPLRDNVQQARFGLGVVPDARARGGLRATRACRGDHAQKAGPR